MRLIEIAGIGKRGNVWRHVLPEDAMVSSFCSRVLVVAPSALYYLDGEGDVEPATAYPKVYEDNGQ